MGLFMGSVLVDRATEVYLLQDKILYFRCQLNGHTVVYRW